MQHWGTRYRISCIRSANHITENKGRYDQQPSALKRRIMQLQTSRVPPYHNPNTKVYFPKCAKCAETPSMDRCLPSSSGRLC